MGGKIFVNYRRDDSAPHALSVAQYLEREFGSKNVFLDIDRLRPGQRFPQVLEERLTESRVMLTVIGPSWLSATNEAGQRRLDDPEDWVRMEICRALAQKIPVIPVLVGGASLPRKSELPDDLKPLLEHQVATITTNGFRTEMAGLARDLQDFIRPPRTWPLAAGALAGAAVAALGLGMYLGFIPTEGLAPQFTSPDTRPVEQETGARNADAAAKPAAKEARVEAAKETSEPAARQASPDTETNRNAREAERQRLAMLQAERDHRPVSAHVVGNSVGYIRVSEFSKDTAGLLADAVSAIKPNSRSGYILDLRNTSGANLFYAGETADTFLDRGAIAFVRRGEEVHRVYARPGDLVDGARLVVLVDANSSFSSHVVAQALKAHDRATIIGMRSDGAVPTGPEEYYDPSNRNLSLGLDPDIEVKQSSTGPESDVQLQFAISHLIDGH